MVDQLFDYQFRLIVIGDSTVGKSSVLRYLTEGSFDDTCDPTVGVDFYTRLIEPKPGIKVKLQLWDTAGQERFRSITESYYRNSVGVVLVYDITKKTSFEHLGEWLDDAQSHIEPQKAVYILVGHKSDMDSSRAISTSDGQRFADFHGMRFLETSAVTGENIEEVFLTITKDVYAMLVDGQVNMADGWDGIKGGPEKPPRPKVKLPDNSGDSAQSNNCC